jgi:hypothetical protein
MSDKVGIYIISKSTYYGRLRKFLPKNKNGFSMIYRSQAGINVLYTHTTQKKPDILYIGKINNLIRPVYYTLQLRTYIVGKDV